MVRSPSYGRLLLLVSAALASWLCPPAHACTPCDGIGDVCGAGACCSGMNTRCGDESRCTGISSRCGSDSICTGMDSRCGPRSVCRGLGVVCGAGSKCSEGAECEGGRDSGAGAGGHHMKPMKPFKPFKPFKPLPVSPPSVVHNHGCDTGPACKGREGASDSNGVRFCCPAGCDDCSVSTSQSDDVLTATCVCDRASAEKRTSAKAAEAEEMAPMKPMKPMKPMEPMKPFKPFKPIKTSPPTTVHNHGCDTGDVCQGRPGSAESNGLRVCCPAGCQDCDVSTSQTDSVLTATCRCLFWAGAGSTREATDRVTGHEQDVAAADLEMKPLKPMKPMKPMEPFKPFKPFKPLKTSPPKCVHSDGCDVGAACEGRQDVSEANGVKVCCPADCPGCSISVSQTGSTLTATCVCNRNELLVEKDDLDPMPTMAPWPSMEPLKPLEPLKPMEPQQEPLKEEEPHRRPHHNHDVPASPAPSASPQEDVPCDAGDACRGRSGSESNGEHFCCPQGCPDCSISVASFNDKVSATCRCLFSDDAAAPTPRVAGGKGLCRGPVVAAAVGAGAAALGLVGWAAFRLCLGRRSEGDGVRPLLSTA